MTVRVGINGFGRIGRNVLRAIKEYNRTDVTIVAINDVGDLKTNVHLLKYDSVHGPFHGEVKVEGDGFDIGTGHIKVLNERDPSKLPWASLGVDIVMECTGIFSDKEKASAHLTAGAKKVLVSAPSKGADLTVVYGVNHDKLEPITRSSRTPPAPPTAWRRSRRCCNDLCGIAQGYMTTIHSYTNDQRILDLPHKDLRRARAAALSMIPTSTGAAKAVGLVLPELAGKLDGTAIRVPTPNVSVIDLCFIPGRETSVADINAAMERASQNELKGILSAVKDPLVSIDFNHNPHSSNFDLAQTQIVEGKLVRVLSWYDNEWGFSCRMADTAVAMAKLI